MVNMFSQKTPLFPCCCCQHCSTVIVVNCRQAWGRESERKAWTVPVGQSSEHSNCPPGAFIVAAQMKPLLFTSVECDRPPAPFHTAQLPARCCIPPFSAFKMQTKAVLEKLSKARVTMENISHDELKETSYTGGKKKP